MEEVVIPSRLPSETYWRGRRVLLTGHTGFKGSWLTLLLSRFGANVYGLSRDIPTSPSLFQLAGLEEVVTQDLRGDVGCARTVLDVFERVRPDVVLHLAAQPLVLQGFTDPVDTFHSNVMGMVNVLEAARRTKSVGLVLGVTTDKVYRNRETDRAFREGDELGGSDPYSASKAAAELVAEAYRAVTSDHGAVIKTARAGNVIGGGDWSKWRLLPDILAAVDNGEEVVIRNPSATRPWQHVLDPLTGYLLLAEVSRETSATQLPACWNFGPDPSSVRSVLDITTEVERCLNSRIPTRVEVGTAVENQLLALDSRQARELLGWIPRLNFEDSVKATVTWHQAFRAGIDMKEFTERQIGAYLGGIAAYDV